MTDPRSGPPHPFGDSELILTPPKNVVQTGSRCWAAATESWLAAHPERTHYTTEQIVSGLREERVVDSAGGLLARTGQPLWEQYFGLRPIEEPCSEFSWEKSEKRLKMRWRPLLLGLNTEGNLDHVVVMFGAEAGDGKPFVVVMDPWYEEGYRKWTIAELSAKKGTLVTWMHRLPLLN
jgi:hypothetical protein